MRRLRVIVLAALALFAWSIVVASAAHAEKGPFWSLCTEQTGKKFEFEDKECTKKSPTKEGLFEKVRLLEKETKEIEAKAGEPFVLEGTGVKIECKALKLKKGAVILGSTGNNFGSSEEVIEFEECSATGNGEPCEVTGKKIVTEPVHDELDFETKELKTGEKLLVFFTPVKGNVFVKIKFTGEGCKLKEGAVEGSVAGEAWQGKKAVLLGSEKLAEINEVA